MRTLLLIALLLFCFSFPSGAFFVFHDSASVNRVEESPAPESRFDQSVLRYINEMRANPADFYREHVVPYIHQKQGRFTGQYTRSLKKAMLSSPSLPLFTTSAALESCARRQADYLARFKGRRLSHDQGNIDFAARMKKAGLHCLAENLYADDDPEALAVVIDLLIDQHVPSFGHRKNLMNPMYTQIGLVNVTPPGGRIIVVMDFGCKRP